MIIPFQESFDPDSGKLVYQELIVDNIFRNLNIIFESDEINTKTFFRLIDIMKKEYNINVNVFLKNVKKIERDFIKNQLNIYIPNNSKLQQKLQYKHLVKILLETFSEYFTNPYPIKLTSIQESISFECDIVKIKEYLLYLFHPLHSPSIAFTLALQTHINNIYCRYDIFDQHNTIIKHCLSCKKNNIHESRRNKYWLELCKTERDIFEIQYFVYYLKTKIKNVKEFRFFYNKLKLFEKLYIKYYNKLDMFNVRGD